MRLRPENCDVKRGSFIREPTLKRQMPPAVEIPHDDEFKKELREVLAKPDSWYLERVDRAVRGAGRAARKHRRVPAKS